MHFSFAEERKSIHPVTGSWCILYVYMLTCHFFLSSSPLRFSFLRSFSPSLSRDTHRQRTFLQVPFGHSLPSFPLRFRTLRCLQFFFLTRRESRNRGHFIREPSNPGCIRWSNETFLPRVPSVARARIQCASPAGLSRIISHIYIAALPLSYALYLTRPLGFDASRSRLRHYMHSLCLCLSFLHVCMDE